MESFDRHEPVDDVDVRLDKLIESNHGLIEYSQKVSTLREAFDSLLYSEYGAVGNIEVAGSETRQISTRYCYAEYDGFSDMVINFGNHQIEYRLLIFQDLYPMDEMDNKHYIVCLQEQVDSFTDEYMHGTSVFHFFANGSVQVFPAQLVPFTCRFGSFDDIKSGKMGPYICESEDGAQVSNLVKRFKLNADSFREQHWTLSQVDSIGDDDMVTSKMLIADIEPLYEHFEERHPTVMPDQRD